VIQAPQNRPQNRPQNSSAKFVRKIRSQNWLPQKLVGREISGANQRSNRILSFPANQEKNKTQLIHTNLINSYFLMPIRVEK